jgi:hypothetical protein
MYFADARRIGMPHADLKYSSDLNFDAAEMLRSIEATIQAHDAGSGECKGRAYPSDVFHHSHLIVEVSLLPKAHRDQAFLDALGRDLEHCIKGFLSQPCMFSLALNFGGAAYITNAFAPS